MIECTFLLHTHTTHLYLYFVNVCVSLTVVPPSIRGSDEVSTLTVTVGGLITLVCESSGIPPPGLTWKKNGKIIIIIITNQSIIISFRS